MIRWASPVALGFVLLASCARPVAVAPAPVLPAIVGPLGHVAVVPVTPPVPRPAPSPEDPQVRADLRKAAADHTNSGTALRMKSFGTDVPSERRALLLRALDEHRRAARDWTSLFGLDPDAADGPETRYWLADAWRRIVGIEEALDGTPSLEELAAARRAAVSARATNRGVYGEAAAGIVVEIADLALKLQHRLHARTKGAQGIEERRDVRTAGEGDALRAVTDPLPREVLEAIAARDAYLERVAPADALPGKRAEIALQAAELHFLYGHFAEARRRFLLLYDPARCGPSDVGYRAWARLIAMASLEGDVPAARKLAQGRLETSCNPEGPGPRAPHGGAGASCSEAYRLFERAEKSSQGPERDKLWREAADAYRAGLAAAPDRDEAPECALNGAYAYKQIGAYVEALALYRLLLDRYGSEASLARLAAGDPHATPPRPPDPHRYDERRKFAQMAAQQLAAAEILALDYRAAAGVYDLLAGNARFDADARRDAARNAVILHGNLGERDRALAARAVFARLDPPPRALAEVDWRVVRTSLDAWNERAPDTDPNRAARLAALVEVERFVARHEADADAARVIVHAAEVAARLRRAVGDPQAAAWCARAMRAFDRARAAEGPEGEERRSPEAELAAGCAAAELDAAVRADFGGASGPRRYRGAPAAIERAFLSDLARVEAHARRIDELARRVSRAPWLQGGPWLVAARATDASLLDACRAGLAALATDDDRLRRALRRADEQAARASLEVVFLADAARVVTREVVDARRRLAALTRLLGEPAMRALGAALVDPVSRAPLYREGMFSSPPGMTASGGDELAPPLPAP